MLVDYGSSTTGEVAAITAALGAVQSIPSGDIVILTDSRAAIQRIMRRPSFDTSTHLATERTVRFALRRQCVVLQ